MKTTLETYLPRASEEDIDQEQAWFSSQDWLEGEREASRQIAQGQTSFYHDEEALERAFAGQKRRGVRDA